MKRRYATPHDRLLSATSWSPTGTGLAERIELVTTPLSPVQGKSVPGAGKSPDESPEPRPRQVLFDWPVICEYLDDIAHTPKLLPAAGQGAMGGTAAAGAGRRHRRTIISCAYEASPPEDRRWSSWTEGQTRKAHQGPPRWTARTWPAR
ncbi:MAG: hypothetical protein J2P48_00765 [Alphaproteobacteria bacterium]|nr:hypothetical protein [Alphaproteobacteria bacterium]